MQGLVFPPWPELSHPTRLFRREVGNLIRPSSNDVTRVVLGTAGRTTIERLFDKNTCLPRTLLRIVTWSVGRYSLRSNSDSLEGKYEPTALGRTETVARLGTGKRV